MVWRHGLFASVFPADATAFVQEGPSSPRNHFPPKLLEISPCSIARCMPEVSDHYNFVALLDKLGWEVEQAFGAFDQIRSKVKTHLSSAALYDQMPSHLEALDMPEKAVVFLDSPEKQAKAQLADSILKLASQGFAKCGAFTQNGHHPSR